MSFVVTSREGVSPGRPLVPCTFVIFGAAGDLSRRKLLPSLYRLWAQKLLHPQTAVVGVARREWNDDQFREMVAEALTEFIGPEAVQAPEWEGFSRRLFFAGFDLRDTEGYRRLRERSRSLADLELVGKQLVFYLSIPPEVFTTVLENLRAAELTAYERTDFGEWPRIVVEKPFGRDLDSSRALNALLLRSFRESQIYRIDHYLGKESVQNLLVFRFGNTIYESIWNRRYVDHVQITVAEEIGVGTRAATYEQMGALRDIVQNHLIQLLATVAMEPPSAIDAKHVRQEKVKIIESVRPLREEEVAEYFVRAQYTAGTIQGEPVPGYREEPGVAPNSVTETFVAGKLYVDTWRWSGVPFYVRTGKRLPKRITEVAIQFKEPPMLLFRGHNLPQPNVLVMRIQPNEGISLSFAAKAPGVSMELASVEMNFLYEEAFHQDLPDAYETLLLDVIVGDQMLFAHAELHEAAWQVLMPILNAWEETLAPLYRYPAGTWGPEAAEKLLSQDGRRWRRL
ncbi:MAG: glucose-6-phosphate 1-dehydrogenase [Candidatus Poribacteria bacterium]|nr:MAG: glucose-6-phosphate 1-dehydrogenase [Candidatus Poribacteria bacterium]